MSNYWQKRISLDELKAQKNATRMLSKEKSIYQQELNKINQYIDQLYSSIASGKQITRSQLWQYQHFISLRNQIAESMNQIAVNQISIVEDIINQTYSNVLGLDVTAGGYAAFNKVQLQQVINSNWCGSSFSERVWHNSQQLAASIQAKVEDMVILGKMPDDVKKEIIQEFSVSYNQADRLVRTETSYAFNTASIERYKKMGCTKVEFLAEPDCCDECAEYEGKVFTIDAAPIIPIHPNCRCTYLPVVEDTDEEED